MTDTIGIPFRPDWALAREQATQRRGQAFIRAAVSTLKAGIEGVSPERVAARIYPADKNTLALLTTKAAVSPTSMSSTALVPIFPEMDFVSLLSPATAFSKILQAGIHFDEPGEVSLANIGSSSGLTSFVLEGNSIPVRQLSFSADTVLVPQKLATIATFSREIGKYSTPSIETMLRLVLADSFGQYLDSVALDSTVGDATRPPGLRYNITGLTPSSNATPTESCRQDVAALIGSVSAVALNGPVLLIAAARQATYLKLLRVNDNWPVLVSSALSPGTVIALSANSFVSSGDPSPRFSISEDATLIMDTAPGQFSTAGSPNLLGGIARNTFQSDTLALKILFPLTWQLRSASGLAWMQNVLWG